MTTRSRRWREGDVYWAEGDFGVAAFAVADDPSKVGTFEERDGEQVELILASTAALLWDAPAPERFPWECFETCGRGACIVYGCAKTRRLDS